MQHKYTEANARALFRLMEQRLDAFSVLARGPEAGPADHKGTLAKMLEDGGFPETESKAMLEALDALDDAFQDLHMALCLPFEIARNDAEDAIREGRCPVCHK